MTKPPNDTNDDENESTDERRDPVRSLNDRLDALDTGPNATGTGTADPDGPDDVEAGPNARTLSDRQIRHVAKMVAEARRTNPDALMQADEALRDERARGVTSDPGELTAGELALINALAGIPPTGEPGQASGVEVKP